MKHRKKLMILLTLTACMVLFCSFPVFAAELTEAQVEQAVAEQGKETVAKVIQTLTCSCRYVSYDERQDLLQIGNLALCKAAMNYDGSRPFETYAKVVIRNAIYDYWRSLQKERTYTCSMDAIADNETDTSYQQLLADTSSLQNLEQEHNLRSIYEYLQTLQNVNCTTIKKGIQALLLQQNGYTSQEISKHYGVPASHVRAWKSKARKYLQQDATLYALLS